MRRSTIVSSVTSLLATAVLAPLTAVLVPLTAVLVPLTAVLLSIAPATALAAIHLPPVGIGDPDLAIDPDPPPGTVPTPDPNPVPVPNPTPDKDPYITYRGIGGRWLEIRVTAGGVPSTLQRSIGARPWSDYRSLVPNRTITLLEEGLSFETDHCYRIMEGRVSVYDRCFRTGSMPAWPPGVTLRGVDDDRDGVDDAEEMALLEHYAPRFFFHDEEQYFPSSVEYYLEGADLDFGTRGPARDESGVALGPLSIDALLDQSTDQNLAEVPTGWANPTSDYRPLADGSGPQKSLFRTHTFTKSRRGGDLANAHVYGHVRGLPGDRFELQYWLFYPWNGRLGETTHCEIGFSWDSVKGCYSEAVAGVVNGLASHEGDWEHVSVIVDHDEYGWPRLEQVRTSAHGHTIGMSWDRPALEVLSRRPGHLANPTPQIERRYGRPKIFVAHHSHANYYGPGAHSVGSWGELLRKGAEIFKAPGTFADDLATVVIDGLLLGAADTLTDVTTRGPIYLDAAEPGRLVNVGERGHLLPGGEFMAFSGIWGGDVTHFDWGALGKSGNSPTTPLLKDSWCGLSTDAQCSRVEPLEQVAYHEIFLCNNGYDDDGDGLIDLEDPGCTSATDGSEQNALRACDNGLDDDGDGLIDAEDPQCDDPRTSDESVGACRNGIDDDGDGLLDMEDPGCSRRSDRSELGEPWLEGPLEYTPLGGLFVTTRELRFDDDEAFLGDFDGDGRADMIGFDRYGLLVARSMGDHSAPLEHWDPMVQTPFGNMPTGRPLRDPRGAGRVHRIVADLDGDGLDDVMTRFRTDAYAALSNGTRFTRAGYWSETLLDLDQHHPDLWVVDVTGDGLPDLVEATRQGFFVAANTGAGFAEQTLWTDELDHNTGWGEQLELADVSGDGRADIVLFAESGTEVAVAGDGSFLPPTRWSDEIGANQGFSTEVRPRALADVDGDGRMDVVAFADHGIRVARSTGDGFGPSWVWQLDIRHGEDEWDPDHHPHFLEDLDGDGRADFLGLGPHGVVAAYSNGRRFGEPHFLGYGFTDRDDWSRFAGDIRWLADVDGDGWPELIGLRDDEGLVVGALDRLPEPDPIHVPEPSMPAGLGVGLILLIGLGRRRHRGMGSERP